MASAPNGRPWPAAMGGVGLTTRSPDDIGNRTGA
jgi:hypothetical protein